MKYRIIETTKTVKTLKNKIKDKTVFRVQYNLLGKWIYCYENIYPNLILITFFLLIFYHMAFIIPFILLLLLILPDDDGRHQFIKKREFISIYGAKNYINPAKPKPKPKPDIIIHELDQININS